MVSRNFKTSTPVIQQETMASNFENMLSKVNNMIKSDSAYSVWIRMTIGKKDELVFDNSSTNKAENLFMSLKYKKSGAGTANQFEFQVAFDLFDYGQTTRGRVEKLDELLYQAMNVVALDNAKDIFYCRFQYGYNVLGDTQIVSPNYEGLITGIEPNVDYSNGKTYYTITGTSYVEGSQLSHSFDAVSNWNAMDLVLWNLWYYHGNPETTYTIFDENYHGRRDDRSKLAQNGTSPIFNIDIPAELHNSCSNVTMEEVPSMTAIDYCKYVLENTYNINDPKFNGDTDNPGYNLKEGESEPFYTLYITDSGSGGVPTVHIAYIGSGDAVGGIRTINFDFSWYNRTNNIVLGWKPQVNLMAYFLTRAKQEALEKSTQEDMDNENSEIDRLSQPDSWLENNLKEGHISQDAYNWAMGIRSTKLQSLLNGHEARIRDWEESLDALRNENLEYYNSTLTLVGIPSDIPLNILLNIKPRILESVSRTQGKYYVKGATDRITTNGLFTTTLELMRYYNY